MDERDPDRDQDQRDGEAADAGDPTEQLLDPAPDRAGEVPVHPQPEQHPTADEADAEELVFAPFDCTAQIGLGAGSAVP